MKTIVLTGMMGSGKTTIGKLLADKLNVEFIDIDSFIESQENMTISEIFKTKGESEFRQIEEKNIKTVLKKDNQILSLGGGAFESIKTREFLTGKTQTIYLKTSAQTIFNRIKTDSSRPLLCDNMSIEKIENFITKREINYKKANLIIITDNKSPQEILQEITGVIEC